MGRPKIRLTVGNTQLHNPVKQWLVGRRAKREAEERQRRQEQENALRRREAELRSILESIDFDSSPLPAGALAEGGFERTAHDLVQKIGQNAPPLEVDLLPIDEKLTILAYRYRDAIRDGNLNAARAAKAALARGILEIRNRVPAGEPERLEQFVDLNTQYLDEWITLVDYATATDQVERNAQAIKEAHNSLKQQYDEEGQALREEIESDPEKRRIYDAMRKGELNDPSEMTDPERSLFQRVSSQRERETAIEMKAAMCQEVEDQALRYKKELDILANHLSELPLLTVGPAADSGEELLQAELKRVEDMTPSELASELFADFR